MLPAIPYSSRIVTAHAGHRHDRLLLKTGIRGSYGARRGRSALNISAEVLSAAAVRQRPFIEGDSIVSPPDDSEAPVLYTHTLCPYAHRAWLTLLEKGVEFQPVQIDLSQKPSFFSRVSSSGLVPAVAYKGSVITESLDICRWIDKAFQGPALIPEDSVCRDAMETLIRNASSINSAGLDLLAGRTGRSWGLGSGQSEEQRRRLEGQLGVLAKSLTEHGGPYLVGPSITLADMVIFPFVERFALCTPKHAGYNVSTAWDGAIGAWLKAMSARPSCKISCANPERLFRAYSKHGSLDFFDFHKYKAADLHPHLDVAQE